MDQNDKQQIFMKGLNLLNFNCERTILGCSRVKLLTKDDIELLKVKLHSNFKNLKLKD